ncbi:decapping and exoribonuclease protein-like [Brevipalpus obovatus]|uniref:decapping and exoribonuclease protein-like n=1 Tax=Brevipalpus obovatus TaxID=246614 RepID=UPI003D9EDE9F
MPQIIFDKSSLSSVKGMDHLTYGGPPSKNFNRSRNSYFGPSWIPQTNESGRKRKARNEFLTKIPILETGIPKRIEIGSPVRLGTYSVEINLEKKIHKYLPDRSQLKPCIYNPRMIAKYDLLAGYSAKYDWGNGDNYMDMLLEWIEDNKEKVFLPSTASSSSPSSTTATTGQTTTTIPATIKPRLEADFVTSRGVITKIMVAPFERRGWVLAATKINGTIFMTARSNTGGETRGTEYHNILCYSGLKFENLMTTPRQEEVYESLKRGEYGQFCCVMKIRMGRHNLLYAAEMDSMVKRSDASMPIEDIEFMEIKTCGLIRNRASYNYFCARKAPKWWSQCLLGDADKVLCGFRDELLVVRSISRIEKKDLITMNKNWSPQKCAAFLDKFLSFVKHNMDQEGITLQFICAPSKNMVYAKQSTFDVNMPSWFVNKYHVKARPHTGFRRLETKNDTFPLTGW